MLVRLDPNPPPNISRYRWLVLGITFFNQGLIVGLWYIFSVILKPLDAEFGWGRGPLTMVFALTVITQSAAGPLVGWLIDRTSARIVIPIGLAIACLGGVLSTQAHSFILFAVSFGLIMGLGIGGAGWIPNGALLMRWFPDRLSTAVGLSSAGVGVGLMVLVPLAQYLTLEYGWRTAMLTEALLLLPLAAVNLLLQRSAPAPSAAARGIAQPPSPRAQGTDWTLRTALTSAPFWWLALALFANEFTQQLLSVHQIAYLTDAGRPPLEAAFAAGLLGAVAFPGKIFWGYFADRFGRALGFSLGTGVLMLAVPLLALAGSTQGAPVLWLYGIVVGLGFATIGPLAAPMTADLYRGRSFGSIFGAVTVSTGFGSAVGVTLAGWLFDSTGSYTSALGFAVAACILSIAGAQIALKGVRSRQRAEQAMPTAQSPAPLKNP